jgi:hypothetical protein
MTKISSIALEASLDLSSKIAKDNGVPLDKAVSIHLSFLKATATERSDPETREAARTLLKNIFEEAPLEDFDAKEVARRVGLKSGQADTAFIRHQLKMLRLQRTQQAAE